MISDGILALLAMARIGAYAMSLDQTIVFWNESAQRILGYRSEQVLGRRCYEVVAGLTPGALTPACRRGCPSIRRLQAGRVPTAVTMQMRCASGQSKVVSLTPLVVAGMADDAPMLVHLFDDSAEPETSTEATDFVRDELARRGADIVSDHPDGAPGRAGAVKLTKRELEVLRLVSLGWETPLIARELGISTHTVLNHIRHFRQKLNATTKLEAVLTAIRLNILHWE